MSPSSPPAVAQKNLASLLPLDLSCLTKKKLLEYFENTWSLYETLFKTCSDDTLYLIPDPLRRPLIFYLGHTAVFYINKLKLCGLLKESLNSTFEQIFAVGVDPETAEQLNNETSWRREQLPKIQEIWEYRKLVHEKVVSIILSWPEFSAPVQMDDKIWAVLMGCEHERIHLETSIVLFRQLPVTKLTKPEGWNIAPYNTQKYPSNELISIRGSSVEWGKPKEFPSFGWDNEYGKMKAFVPSFQASKFLVSNGEYLEFVKSGEYDNPKNWSQEGWDWKTRVGLKHPHFWVQHSEEGTKYKYRGLFEVMEMPLDWPVDVSWHEAKAFCVWKGPNFRLLSEAEWQRLSGPKEMEKGETFNAIKSCKTVREDVGFRGLEENVGNVHLRFGSSSAVDYFEGNEMGFYDVHGNVWDWTESLFYPLPGFELHPYYEDYSQPCFDSAHALMLGGAWSSTGTSASSFGRFAFRRHFYQNAGFRYARSLDEEKLTNTYETQKLVSEYLLFHFGKPSEILPFDFGPHSALDFSKRVAQEAQRVWESQVTNRPNKPTTVKALDLGCGVGRTAFELTRFATSVDGLDYSQAFVDACESLKQTGTADFEFVEEGKVMRKGVAQVPEELDRRRVHFFRGDACNLPGGLGPYDVVVMANLIDRLHSPLSTLCQIGSLMAGNGILVVTSPYTWLEQFTTETRWLGGFYKEGKEGEKEEVRTENSLKEILGALFELVETKDFPFLIREHLRKYQWSVAQLTVWKRKAGTNEFF